MWKTLQGIFRSRAEEPAAGLDTQNAADSAKSMQRLRDGLLAANAALASSHEQPLLDALLRNRKLEAIKVLRDGSQPRISLSAAKEIIDQLDARLRSR